MYKICRTEKSFSRQRELEEGFLEYMNTVSFAEIEIADLCRYLNMPRKTFYRYFGSKEDALNALVDHRFADLNQYLLDKSGGVPLSSREKVLHYFTFWKGQQHFLDVLMHNYLGGILMVRAVLPVNMPADVLYTPASEKDSPDSYLFNFWATGFLSMMLQWYFSGFKKDAQELADIAQQLYPKSQSHSDCFSK